MPVIQGRQSGARAQDRIGGGKRNQRAKVVIERTNFFEKQARQCRIQAQTASNKADRESWLEMALRWGALRNLLLMAGLP